MFIYIEQNNLSHPHRNEFIAHNVAKPYEISRKTIQTVADVKTYLCVSSESVKKLIRQQET